MNSKNLTMSNIFSLHQELANATEQYEKHLDEGDHKMSDLWFRQMELIVEEMESL